MKSRSVLVWLGLLCIFTPTASLWAQDQAPPEEQTAEEEEYEESSVRAYSISFWGGWFSGGTFLDLQPLADRTQVEEGSNDIYKYDGSGPFAPQELIFPTWRYDGPQKEIEPGFMFGGRLGMYLTDKFHIDLMGSFGKSEAKTTFINSDPENPNGSYREELDRDSNITIFMGGGRLVFDANTVEFLGFSPTVGFGIGGIINRFSYLEDKTGLYFELTGGLNYNLTSHLLVNLEFSAVTFSFSREELQYGKQVTYLNARLGLTWMIPVGAPPKPVENE